MFGISKRGAAITVRPMFFVFASLIASFPRTGKAEDLPVPSGNPQEAPADPIADYFLHWFDRSEAAKASQPHWMTPITTVTPRLEQEFRYDQNQQFLQNGAQIDNYFSGKGLELIPTETNEVLINVPALMHRDPEGGKVKPATGFADWNAVTIKQRIFSAPTRKTETIFSPFFWDFRRRLVSLPLPTSRLGLSRLRSQEGSAGAISTCRGRLVIRSRRTIGNTSAIHSSPA